MEKELEQKFVNKVNEKFKNEIKNVCLLFGRFMLQCFW